MKFRQLWRVALVGLLLSFVLFEGLEYALLPYSAWDDSLPPTPPTDSVRMLLVADPQLLGWRDSCATCRWDADRYIRKTFRLAYEFTNPELVLFLGDIFDEGEVASEEEFASYFQRFKYIFQEVNFDKSIIIPGDNDIGGEGGPPLPEMERRFDKYFRDDVYIPYRFLEFVKVNYVSFSSKYEEAPNSTDTAFRVVLSHVPLVPSYSGFVSRVIPYVRPHIILSAHDHKSEHFVAKRPSGILQLPAEFDFDSGSFNLSESLVHEILIPTCSYRMGTTRMGYGLLDIARNGEVRYSVLWLPHRFRQLMWHMLLPPLCALAAALLYRCYSIQTSGNMRHIL